MVRGTRLAARQALTGGVDGEEGPVGTQAVGEGRALKKYPVGIFSEEPGRRGGTKRSRRGKAPTALGQTPE
ncbi:hypothetical protein GCM10027454_33970 [Algoriphagus aestuariicola]